MPELGSLWYSVGLKDLTDADIKKINDKLKNLGSDLLINPKLAKSITEILPKGIKLEFDPQLKAVSNEALAKAVEGKVMKVEIAPLLTNLRKALRDATKDNPPEMEVGVQSAKLRTIIQNVLNKQGFMLNISTVNDNYSKVVQQKLNGTRYTVRIHADAKEITRSVQASLMQVQSRAFGLQISRDILYRSIDDALGHKRFTINVAVQHDQARKAVQDALLRAQVIGKDQALAYQRLQTGEMKAAQAEILRLKAAHMGAADAAKAHATASINLGGALGSNIKIAGELSSAMASLYSVHAAKEFLSQVIEIGGELEHQKIAMDTIFGDKGKTSELFGQIKGLARQSPFGVMELTKSVKALSAYGVQYNEIYDTAKRLADISAATSVDINRLILAFGKTKSRGFLDGLEAKQFAYANIPIYEMVRRKLEELEGQAVTTAQVMERMKKREIGFDIVKDVLWDMTDEGGKFYNMQEALAGSVKTSWKLVRDNIELMFGEIAESSVGGALKDVAETLQVLTRNWRAMGTMIGASAAAFGVYKVAVAASNAMMGQANALALQKATASNKVAAANAMEAASYRVLTQAEDYAILTKSGLAKLNRSLLLSHRALTEAEWDAVLASKAVSNDYILRRIALGRLTQAEIDYLISIEAVSAAEVQTATRAQGLKVSLASLYATMKAGAASIWASTLNFFTRFKAGMIGVGVSMQKLNFASFTTSIRNAFANALTWIKTLPTRIAHAEVGVTRLKLAFSGLGRAMSSIIAFLLNPVTIAMAAIGGLMYAWQKNNEEMQKAKEIGNNLFTKATEGADNLKKTLVDIKPSAGLSNHKLLQGIEQMEQAIKDYSPTPIKDINDALYTQEGLLRPVADRYDELKKKVEELKGAFDSIESGNLGNAVENAINDTNKGLFDDDINTNVKDYVDALKEREDAIRKFASKYPQYIRKAAKDAREASVEFRNATEGMTDIQAISHLIKNLERYESVKDIASVSNVLKSKVGSYRLDSGFGIESAKTTLLEDMQTFWESIRTDAKLNGIDAIEDATEEVKKGYVISIKNWIQGLEVPDEVKQMMFNYYSNLLKFDFETFNATEQIADSLNQGLEAEVGKALFEKVKNGLELTPEEASQVHQAFEKIYTKLYDKLPDIQKAAFENAIKQQTATGLVWSAQKENQIVAKLNIRTSWQEWQREIDDATGNLKPIQTWVKGASDIPSFIKAAQEGYKEAKTTIDKLKPLMLKAGFEFEFGELLPQGTPSTWYMGLSDMEKQMVDQYNSQIRILKAAQKAGKEYGFDPSEEYNKGNKDKKGSRKDPLAESLKQRFKDIKDAWSEFQKWSKTEGREAAATRIGESGLFSTLSKDKIPQTVEQYRALVVQLEKELREAGVKGTARESLLNDLLKQLLDIDKTIVDEQLKLALDKVSKEAERQLADWNLFDKIRKATGNQDLAMSVAFGMNADATTDYPALVKKQFSEAYKAIQEKNPKLPDMTFDNMTLEKAKELGDDVVKIYEDASGKLIKYAREQKDAIADILNEYQSLQDKLTKIDSDRNRKIKTVQESDMSAPDKAKYIQRINVEADYQKFTQSADYLKFFSGIYSLTMQQAQEIGDKIRLHLDQRLQAGKISAEDYYKEIERINQQLTKLRNVKPDALTFLTEGVKGLNQKGLDKANSDVLEQTRRVEEAEEALAKAKGSGNLQEIVGAEVRLKAVREELEAREKIRDAIVKDMESWEKILAVVNIVSDIAGGISDAFNSIKDMAGALGADVDSGGWADAQAAIETLSAATEGISKIIQGAMNGNVGGILAGAISTITTPFTIWSKLHDQKLEQEIQQSKEYSERLQNIYDAIERRMERFLGDGKGLMTKDIEKDINDARQLQERIDAMRAKGALNPFDEIALNRYSAKLDAIQRRVDAYNEGGAYAYQRELMRQQLEELERQRALEAKKKDSDKEAIAEYDAQIDELEQQIMSFAEETANALYGIDLKGWASQIGDNLIEAFSKGEDAAKAFDDTVSDIMRNLASKMISVGVLEPMFKDLQNYLFGTDGESGAFGKDFELDATELGEMKKYLDAIKNEGVEAARELYEAMNQSLGGILDETDKTTSEATAQLKGLTEDTGGLIASYLNAVRADVSIQTHTYWPKLLTEALPKINVIAEAQLSAQRQIVENTRRNAVAAEAIAKSTNDISGLLKRVSQGTESLFVK